MNQRLLSLDARRIDAYMRSSYGYSPVLLETFEELQRFNVN